MQINNPIHKLEADKANRKDNARVLVYVGRSDAEDCLEGAILLANPGKLGEVRVGRRWQASLAPMDVDKGGRCCCRST